MSGGNVTTITLTSRTRTRWIGGMGYATHGLLFTLLCKVASTLVLLLVNLLSLLALSRKVVVVVLFIGWVSNVFVSV